MDQQGYSPEELVTLIESKLVEYNKVTHYGTIFSVTLVLHLITKLIFNLTADIKLTFDKWTLCDIICSFFNMICFEMISAASPEQFIDPI